MYNIKIVLCIFGKNPVTGDISYCSDDYGLPSIDISKGISDVEAIILAMDYVDADISFYEVRRATFIQLDEESIYLSYNITLPNNIKLKKGKWTPISEHVNLKEEEKLCLIQSLK